MPHKFIEQLFCLKPSVGTGSTVKTKICFYIEEAYRQVLSRLYFVLILKLLNEVTKTRQETAGVS